MQESKRVRGGSEGENLHADSLLSVDPDAELYPRPQEIMMSPKAKVSRLTN